MGKGCLDCIWFKVKKGGFTEDMEMKPDAELYCDAMMFERTFKWVDKFGYALDTERRQRRAKVLRGCQFAESPAEVGAL